MEDVHATNHCGLVHERQLIHCPGNSTKLGIHLDQHLRDDRSQILASLYGRSKDHLGGNGVLGQEELLDVIIKLALSFLAG